MRLRTYVVLITVVAVLWVLSSHRHSPSNRIARPSNMDGPNKEIFVSMHTTSVTLPTILSRLLQKSVHPHRVRFGIASTTAHTGDNVVSFLYLGSDGGPAHSRGKIEATLWRGEPYYMAMEEDMEFQYGWDVSLTTQLDLCRVDKAVLTCVPNPGGIATFICARNLDVTGIRYKCRKLIDATVPVRSLFVNAAFTFGRSDRIRALSSDASCNTTLDATTSKQLHMTGWVAFAPSVCVVRRIPVSKAAALPLSWATDHGLHGADAAQYRQYIGLRDDDTFEERSLLGVVDMWNSTECAAKYGSLNELHVRVSASKQWPNVSHVR